jgi:hypothetical protein
MLLDDFRTATGVWAKATKGSGQPHAFTLSGRKWFSIVERCGDAFQKRNPAYLGCTNEFGDFQDFVEWHRSQRGYGRGLEIDKDLLVRGNKTYKAEACTLLPKRLNQVLTALNRPEGPLPLGVAFLKRERLYLSTSSDGAGNVVRLGYFKNPDEAFQVYKTFKEGLIRKYAEDYRDVLEPAAYDALKSFAVTPRVQPTEPKGHHTNA